MGPPVEELKADFPLRPVCMGNLVPQQINLWMGAAPTGQQLQAPSLIHPGKVLNKGVSRGHGIRHVG